MVYRIDGPVTKSKSKKISVKHFLPLMANPGSDYETEYNGAPAGLAVQSARTMPFIGQKYSHRTNGWHVCRQFYLDCCNRTDLKSYPTTNGQVQTGGNVGLTQLNVEAMLAAFGGNTDLLYATSLVASQLTLTSLSLGFWGVLNGGPQLENCVLRFNGDPAMLMLDFNHMARNMTVKVGKGGRPEIDSVITWTSPRARLADPGGRKRPLTVGDFGATSVEFATHLVLQASQTAVAVKKSPSWIRFRLLKTGTKKGLFSSSASPSDMDDMFENIPDL
jgi:hypothetical protein